MYPMLVIHLYRNKRPGKRSVPSDFESGAVTPLVKLPKKGGSGAKDMEAEIKKEIEAANLGKPLIHYFCILII